MLSFVRTATVLGAAFVLFSCEHRMEVNTKVYPNGALDRTLTLISSDSLPYPAARYLGVHPDSGWAVVRETVYPRPTIKAEATEADSSDELRPKFRYVFQKTFASAAASNRSLGRASDSLFRITGTFQKRFRWFYTYVRYTDTYHAVNRFSIPVEHYLTEQDFAFIDGLPAEGKSISHADSLFLDALHDRIYDEYASRGYFDEYFALLLKADISEEKRKQLRGEQNKIFESLKNNKETEDDFLPALADSLGVVLEATSPRHQEERKRIESKLKFMFWASEGHYRHTIEMPGQVLTHNADSISGNRLMWSPPALKFMVRDYSFQAESRISNLWAWVLSAAVVVASVLLWLFRQRT
ncbi:MAG: hypothetical protein MUC38_06255 [Cyclobacteriaceae bacterium]|jgi:hypothetical protein|nr:hypothetical protein [Cyclobacteriaceae bacterium]